MFSRFALILTAALGLSGQGKAAPPAPAGGLAQAKALWEQGQSAMRAGRPARAIDFYTKSLACAPGLTKNHLSLAAAYLEVGNNGLACFHLNEHARAHPEDLLARAQLAELLLRLDRRVAAQGELESCVEAAQELGSAACELLIHCHSRLMEIAESQGDVYGEHLQRGIGLLLLAGESAASPEAEKELPSEGLYCKAAAELTLALDERPDAARPSWYLHTVWCRLGQRQPALRCLGEAEAVASFSYLTPVERRALHLAASLALAPPRSRR